MDVALDFVVYAAKHKDRVLYVGSGRRGREQHINSGRSHSAALNRHYFTLGAMEVEIVASGLTKRDSVQHEMRLIRAELPYYNVKGKAPEKITVPMHRRRWPHR